MKWMAPEGRPGYHGRRLVDATLSIGEDCAMVLSAEAEPLTMSYADITAVTLSAKRLTLRFGSMGAQEFATGESSAIVGALQANSPGLPDAEAEAESEWSATSGASANAASANSAPTSQPVYERPWQELTAEQQRAAAVLEYSQETWDDKNTVVLVQTMSAQEGGGLANTLSSPMSDISATDADSGWTPRSRADSSADDSASVPLAYAA